MQKCKNNPSLKSQKQNTQKSKMKIIFIIIYFTLISAEKQSCGKSQNYCEWEYNETTTTLSFTGTGYMKEYQIEDIPWIKYQDEATQIVIDGIKSITSYSFANFSKIVEIVIPPSIVTIRENAFRNMSSLKRLEISENVDLIWEYAFSDCEQLEYVYINRTTSLSSCDTVFTNCSSLKYIFAPQDNLYASFCGIKIVYKEDGKIFDSGACSSNRNYCNWKYTFDTNELFINGSGNSYNYNDKIGIPWFEYVNEIKKLTIQGIKYIGKNLFSELTQITEVMIPHTVRSIDENSFENCINLKTVHFEGEGIENLRTKSFYNCSSLETIILPKSIKEIKNMVFAQCSSLKSIHFNGIRDIKQCDDHIIDENKLIGIIVPDNYENSTFCKLPLMRINNENEYEYYGRCGIGTVSCNYVFSEKTGEITFTGNAEMKTFKNKNEVDWKQIVSKVTKITLNGITSISSFSFSGFNQVTEVILPNTITSIGNYAFEGCSKLQTVQISSSVKTIGLGVFLNCSELREITVDSQNNYFMSENGILYNKQKTIIKKYPEQKTDIYFKIPESVYIIEESCFQNNNYLQNVDISKYVVSIKDNAFKNLQSLSEILIPINCNYLGNNAFSHCPKVKRIETKTIRNIQCSKTSFESTYDGYPVVVPSNYIDETFCSKNVNQTGQKVNEYIEGPCYDSIGHCKYHFEMNENTLTISGDGIIPDYDILEYRPWHWFVGKISTVIIENDITSIGKNAFYKIKSISEVELGEDIEYIGENAFINGDIMISVLYHGTRSPKCDEKSFPTIIILELSKVYADDNFCGELTFNELETILVSIFVPLGIITFFAIFGITLALILRKTVKKSNINNDDCEIDMKNNLLN